MFFKLGFVLIVCNVLWLFICGIFKFSKIKLGFGEFFFLLNLFLCLRYLSSFMLFLIKYNLFKIWFLVRVFCVNKWLFLLLLVIKMVIGLILLNGIMFFFVMWKGCFYR